jgi:hypothetical protein
VVEDVPVPSPGPGEVLVRVMAAGVAPWDAIIRRRRARRRHACGRTTQARQDRPADRAPAAVPICAAKLVVPLLARARSARDKAAETRCPTCGVRKFGLRQIAALSVDVSGRCRGPARLVGCSSAPSTAFRSSVPVDRVQGTGDCCPPARARRTAPTGQPTGASGRVCARLDRRREFASNYRSEVCSPTPPPLPTICAGIRSRSSSPSTIWTTWSKRWRADRW